MGQDISLLNTAIGPIMRGPSSSHSAAPFMIGRMVRELALSPGAEILGVTVTFDPSGSFAEVYRGQGSDEGFAAGLCGVSISSSEYADALPKLLRGEGFQFEISIAPLRRNDHPNRVELVVEVKHVDGPARLDRFEAVSLGGGVFEVTLLNDIEINLDGSAYVLLVECIDDTGHAAIVEMLRQGAKILDWQSSGAVLVVRLREGIADVLSRDIISQPDVRWLRAATPTQIVVADRSQTLIGATQMLAELGSKGDLVRYATGYECQRLKLPAVEVDRLFDERATIMLASIQAGFSAQRNRLKYIEPSATRVASALLPAALEHGLLKTAIAGALAAMEHTTNRGVVCAAPTAGSAGIVPGTLHAIVTNGASRKEQIQFLKVASLVGALFAVRGSFAAETGGCSVETGASAAMAAAGLAHHFGGTAEHVMGAASLCLMNTLGLICDPVGGEVEIPCHARNVAGIGHVWSAVTAALSGFDAVIPFDELVEQTTKVGRMMHPDLRCTARGGCATTPKALQLVQVAMHDRCHHEGDAPAPRRT